MAKLCPPSMAFMLYNPVRKFFTNRIRIIRNAGITTDSVVLEVGCGNGFFTEVLAQIARKVIAVEVQGDMAKKLSMNLGQSAPSPSVEIYVEDISELSLPTESIDVAFLYYSFHEIKKQDAASAVIARAVKSGGILALYEPTIEVGSKAMDQSIGMFEKHGFTSPFKQGKTLFTRQALMVKSEL